MKNFRLYWLILAVFLTSCSKSDLKPIEGHYVGYYYTYLPGTTTPQKSTNAVTLHLNTGKTYNTSPNADRKPAGGSGDFEITNNGYIAFKDANVWTADFDWNLILNGKFTYETRGDSLILTRYHEPCPQCSRIPLLYQYRLKRIN